MRALLIHGTNEKKLLAYAKFMKFEVVGTTTLKHIYDDYIFYHPDLVLYGKPVDFEQIYQIKSTYPFRFIFYSPDSDAVLDTKYLPVYTDLCKMILNLKQNYKLSWPKIITYLNTIGVKPLPPMRGGQFNHRNVEHILKNCRGRKE